MGTENYRKEAIAEAKAASVEESPMGMAKSIVVNKTLEDKSILPSKHIATIENVVSDQNIGEAIKAVKRNKGAPGIDEVTTGARS